MDKIKRYVECYIPITTCNLHCSYCYVAQQGLFASSPMKLDHTPAEIGNALSVEKLGGICCINLCGGGETLLTPEVLDIIRALLEQGHYVMVVTNGTLTQRFNEIALFPSELLKRLFFKFSFHYLELKRLNRFDIYFDNVKKVARAGASFTVELMPHDELIPLIPEIKQVCMDNLGVLCHCTIGRLDIDPDNRIPHLSALPFEEYLRVWSEFDSDLFQYKSTIFYRHQDGFCYAGDWSVYVHLGTGAVTQCYGGKCIGNIFDSSPLPFEAIGKKCTQAHCYNGHAFLAWGDIPEHNSPTYAQLRNRVKADGSEWLQPEMKEFMSSKLRQSNETYTFYRKWQILRQGKISES